MEVLIKKKLIYYFLCGRNHILLKINYKKMNKGNLKCTFYCNCDETQEHIFQHCQPILSRISYPVIVNLKDIYGSVDDQLSIIKNLTEVDRIRRLKIEDILPGGLARTHVST